MASYAIRKTWFTWPATGVQAKVGPSGVGPPQTSEAAFLTALGPWLQAGTRTTQAAGAVLAGNVVSSVPAAAANAPAGTKVAYLVSV